jgi:Trypsin-co-occurring domain 1
MSTITQIQLPDGQVIYARVSGQVPSANSDDIAHDVGFTDKIPKLASDQLTKLAEGVVTNVRDAVSQFEADEVSIDFGIEFTGKTGRVIGVLAEVGGTANVVLHLTWRGGTGPAPRK